jgi:hypothetical protein
MNQNLKILLTGLSMCIATLAFIVFIQLYVFNHLGDWTMATVNKFLVFHWTTLDNNLIRWLPLIVGVAYVISGKKRIDRFIKRVLLTLLSVIIVLILGILIALITWTSDGADSPLLPRYIKYQPFENYWTVFIVIGILISTIPIFFNQKESYGDDDTIDE